MAAKVRPSQLLTQHGHSRQTGRSPKEHEQRHQQEQEPLRQVPRQEHQRQQKQQYQRQQLLALKQEP